MKCMYCNELVAVERWSWMVINLSFLPAKINHFDMLKQCQTHVHSSYSQNEFFYFDI